jgi:glycosyltransferase involved in cell wall biosynthesis
MTTAPRAQVGYILRSYPRLSQTFILHEILALEQLGLDLRIFAITNPHEPTVQAQVAAVRAPVHYLEAARQRRRAAIFHEHLQVARAAPGRYLQTLAYVQRHQESDAGYSTISRHTAFLQAVYLTRLLRDEQRRTGRRIGHLHAHFAHDPTLIAWLAHRLTGISYSFTAHARDLYQIPATALTTRVAAARSVITCCAPNVTYLHGVVPAPLRAKVRLIHHGVNLQGFAPAAPAERAADPPLILSVGRLVEKKGFPALLDACGRLKQAGYRFRCVIYGDGPLRTELQATIDRLGLAEEVRLAGECTQQELVPMLQRAALFVLTPFVTEDGDRDGVPNVLVEAMACGVPVVSTTVGGVTDLVRDGHNGLLAPPHDVAAIAAAMAALLDDAPRRVALGVAARRTVVEHFDLAQAARQLAALFDGPPRGELCLPS